MIMELALLELEDAVDISSQEATAKLVPRYVLILTALPVQSQRNAGLPSS